MSAGPRPVGGPALLPGGPEFAAIVARLNAIYPTQGGLSCGAQATLSSFRMPTRFAEREGGTGFFAVPHLATTSLTLCSPGFAVGGACPHRYALLLGDFGLVRSATRPNASDDCLLGIPGVSPGPGCSNGTYRGMAQSLYLANRTEYTEQRWASRFAEAVHDGLPSPSDETRFWMSFSGEEHGYRGFTEAEGGGTAVAVVERLRPAEGLSPAVEMPPPVRRR